MDAIRNGVMAAVLCALVSSPAAWAEPDPNMPTDPDDPRCATMPAVAQCQGSPYAPPTGPLDPQCMQMPANAACMGSPYLPQPPPPPPMPVPMVPMTPPMGGMPGMPGHI